MNQLRRCLPITVFTIASQSFLIGCSANVPGPRSSPPMSPPAQQPVSVRKEWEGAVHLGRIESNDGDEVARCFSVLNPSPSDPISAAMKIRPEKLAAGETAEILVYARIAAGHYVYAANNSTGVFAPTTVKVTLPSDVEALGDWQFPAPEWRNGDAFVYRNSFLARRSIKVLAGAAPRTETIAGELHYQACNDELCWPPDKADMRATLVIGSKRR